MNKLVLLYLLVILPITLLSQQTYPIQTILKGDSVVIYTVEQNNDIEILLENQRSRVTFYKNNIAKQQNIIDSLNQKLINQQAKQQAVIDSIQAVANNLQLTLKNKFSNFDSLQQRYDSVSTWLYNTASSNAIIYYSYAKSTVMAIDLASYIIVGYKRSGNFSVARRGPVSDDLYWKNYNREMKDEPNEDWLTYYKDKWKPTQIQFPYSIQPQP
jgi:uncharacterized coiled-coil protein SlyX